MLRHLRVRTPLSLGLVLIVGGLFASRYWDLYYRVLWYDKALHLLGGITAGWLALSLLQDEITHLRAWKQLLVIISIAVSIGVVWEWAEYLSTVSHDVTPWLYRWFHGGDLADTLADLVSDTAGAFLVTLWALAKERK